MKIGIARKRVKIEVEITQMLKYIFHCILLFGFLFEFPLFGPITSRRLCTIYAFGVLMLKAKERKQVISLFRLKNIVFFSLLMLFCFAICCINFLGVNRVDSNVYFEVNYLPFVIVYILVWAVFCAVEFKDVTYFSKVYLTIMLLQSFVSYLAAVSTEFRLFIYENFYYGDNRFATTIQSGTRIMAINLHSSAGSIVLCTGGALLVYLRLSRKIKMSRFLVGYMLILISTIFIGRTGFYLMLGFLVLYFLLEREFVKKFVMAIFLGGLTLIALQIILSKINPHIAELIVSWAFEFFNEETRYNTLNILQGMDVPKLTLEMIFGTNIMSGRTPMGQSMLSDSGYAKIYCALGIVGAISYYLAFVYMFLATKLKGEKIVKIFLYTLIAVAFVIEYKEPYFMKYNYAFFVLTLLIFNAREKNLALYLSPINNQEQSFR